MQLLKKEKSTGVDNIPAELVQAGGGALTTVLSALTTVFNKIWQTQEWQTPWTQFFGHHTSQEKQPAAIPELPKDQSNQPSKQSRTEDHTEHTEAAI